MGATFVPNPAGIRALLASPAMVKAMERVAEKIEAEAVRLAPVRTGNYVNSFSVHADVHDGVARGVVSNNAHSEPSAGYAGGYPYCQALEFGTSKMRAQRIMGRALDAINLA
jgi:HK97 gp10 family phage protein